MPNSPEVEARINAIRFLACDAVQKANSGHPGMPLGAAATAYTLWTNHLRFDPTDPASFDRDRYVLSAGHGSAMLYALLHLYGYDVTIDDLKAFRQWGSKTPGHPEYRHTPGVEATTGPLGQGIANAVGMAIAAAHEAALYNRDGKTIVNRRIYAHCGDGDLMEGISQEAISLAGHLRLGNLTFIYDDNRVSLAGPTDLTYDENRDERFEASGWHVETIKVKHGNDVEDINQALERIKKITDRPTLLRVRTHIGYGSPLQDSFKAHGEPLGAENLAKTKTTLGWPVEPSFLVPDDVAAFFAKLASQKTKERHAWDSLTGKFSPTPMPGQLPWPDFDASNGAIATRDAGGIVMNAIAPTLPQLIGGSADLDPSTKTYLKECGDFEPGHFDGRNIHFGVREHVMGAIANGIAYHGGFIPFTATFFNFLDYMKPAVRLAALAKLHTVFVYTHDSIFLGEDGPTHQPVEQLATLRATPGLTIFRPADAIETRDAWRFAVENADGPTVIVLTRHKVPFLGARKGDAAQGAYVFADATTPQLAIIATGSEVSLACDAKKLLDAKGVATRVISMPSWERFEAQSAEYRESILPASIKQRASLEAGSTFGWHRWIGADGLAIGVDRFGASAPMATIAEHYGFTATQVAAAIFAHFSTR